MAAIEHEKFHPPRRDHLPQTFEPAFLGDPVRVRQHPHDFAQAPALESVPRGDLVSAGKHVDPAIRRLGQRFDEPVGGLMIATFQIQAVPEE